MTAEIIRLPTALEAGQRAFRRILEESELSEEAAEWIFIDAWPRFCAIWENGVDERIALLVTLEIFKLEVALYEARFGKPAARL